MARHWCTAVANVLFGAAFPWGTLLINIAGSLVIGFFFAITGLMVGSMRQPAADYLS
jgi:CrcB protein